MGQAWSNGNEAASMTEHFYQSLSVRIYDQDP